MAYADPYYDPYADAAADPNQNIFTQPSAPPPTYTPLGYVPEGNTWNQIFSGPDWTLGSASGNQWFMGQDGKYYEFGADNTPNTKPWASKPTDLSGLVQYWQGTRPVGSPDLPGLVNLLKMFGVDASIPTHAGGLPSDDKISANGSIYDLIYNYGGPDSRWTFNQLGAGDNGGAVDSSLLAAMNGKTLLDPFTEPFIPPAAPETPYTPPPAFDYPDFAAPGAEDILKEPGFQARLLTGRQILENDRAAKGLYRTGDTARKLNEYAQNFGSNEYGNIFARAKDIYTTNRGNAADKYATNYATQFTDPYQFNSTGLQQARNNALTDYMNRFNIFRSNQDSAFNKLYQTTSLGANTAAA